MGVKMKTGPAKKPTVLKMRDNARIKKPRAREPQPRLKLPNAPKHLSPAAKKIWRKMGKILLKQGLITEADESSFSLWCTAYADLQDLEVKIQNQEPTYISASGNILPNPVFYILYKLRAQVDRFGCRFGMNPSDRSGISVGTRDEANPYRAWQQGRVTNGGKKKTQKAKKAE
jgi:P27 family predicted phage terminase small subunit